MAARRRIREDRIVRNTLESLIGSRLDGPTPAARENARPAEGENNTLPPIRSVPPRDQSSDIGPTGIRRILRFQEANRDEEGTHDEEPDQPLQPLDGFVETLAEWNSTDGGRDARAQLEAQLRRVWPFPPNGDPYRAGDGGPAGRGSQRRLDLSPAVASSGDARVSQALQTWRLCVMLTVYRGNLPSPLDASTKWLFRLSTGTVTTRTASF